jgi:hypothetical protein
MPDLHTRHSSFNISFLLCKEHLTTGYIQNLKKQNSITLPDQEGMKLLQRKCKLITLKIQECSEIKKGISD